MTRLLGSPLLVIADRVFGADPGLLRLRLAVRGTLSAALTTLAAVAIGHALHVTPAVFAVGIVFSTMAPFLMREPTLAQQRRTLVFLLVPSIFATIATTLLHGYGLAGEGFFLVLVFLGYLLQPRAPRMMGIGLIAVITSYVGLLMQLPVALLPLQLLAIVLALAVVGLVCLVALPVTPAATLRRAVRAVQVRAAQVLKSARQFTHGRIPSPAAEAVLRRDLARLNEAVLAADDQLAFVEPDGRDAMRKGLIDLELAAAHVIDAMRGKVPDRRDALRLYLHGKRMSRGEQYSLPVSSLEEGSLVARLVELGHALHRLSVAARKARKHSVQPVLPTLPPGPLAWRLATRITLAAGLAMAGGMALSPNRWFWAVITVYVLFLNTRSRGDTIYKAGQRVGGTILGIAAGLALAAAVGGDPIIEAVLLLLSVFGMFYFYTTSYTLGVFCVTVVLGMIYGSVGEPVETLFRLRLEETAIGAAAAIFVATFVLPTRTRDQVMASGRNLLTALADALKAIVTEAGVTEAGVAEASVTEAGGGRAGVSPQEAMRKVDRQVADLRLSLAPLNASRRLFRRSALERPVPVLLDCVHATRMLVAASTLAVGSSYSQSLLRRLLAVEAHLRGLATSSIATLGAASVPVDPAYDPEPAADPALGPVMGVPLQKLEQTVKILVERLQIGALEGFALDG
jgi:uncharacterized membrane protein YccC